MNATKTPTYFPGQIVITIYGHGTVVRQAKGMVDGYFIKEKSYFVDVEGHGEIIVVCEDITPWTPAHA